MKYDIKQDLNETFQELNNTLDKFDDNSFNIKPSSGGWNAGEVCEHLLKSDVSPLLDGNLEDAGREKDEKVQELKDVFLDFNAKYPNPDFNSPEKDRHDIDEMRTSLKKIHDNALNAIEEKDLTKICKDMELPGSGLMTGHEWLYFVIYHYQRHTHQMKKILESI